MAWEDGSELLSQLIEVIKDGIADAEIRSDLYEAIMETLQEHDYNAFGECRGIDKAFDAAWEEIYGDWDDDHEDADDDEDDVFADNYNDFGDDDY